MNQCVPSWDLDDSPNPPKISLQTPSISLGAPDVPSLDYEVAELTWENGQLAMHGLGPPKVPNKAVSSYGGTLESLVNQATRCIPPHLHGKSAVDGNKLTVETSCSLKHLEFRPPPIRARAGLDGSARGGSCSGTTNSRDWMAAPPARRVDPTRNGEWSSRADMSVSGSRKRAGR
ncbi:hypothetical protein HAX54_006917 [Datura stramonium]|uniref:Uncharacterized protein n=1 Tax=Datura stramonium TaxID=4076 RepID=A0ABS8WUE7_DATST|nr:hypothetical protein [Datura stramonium]